MTTRTIRLLARKPIQPAPVVPRYVQLMPPDTTPEPLPYDWRCVIEAPAGGVIPGTEAVSKAAAIKELLGEWTCLWPDALAQGYRLKWVKVEREVA